jgi:hypothetical protein
VELAHELARLALPVVLALAVGSRRAFWHWKGLLAAIASLAAPWFWLARPWATLLSVSPLDAAWFGIPPLLLAAFATLPPRRQAAPAA